jgi:hypothetical protein
MTGRVEGAAAAVLAGDPGQLDELAALAGD